MWRGFLGQIIIIIILKIFIIIIMIKGVWDKVWRSFWGRMPSWASGEVPDNAKQGKNYEHDDNDHNHDSNVDRLTVWDWRYYILHLPNLQACFIFLKSLNQIKNIRECEIKEVEQCIEVEEEKCQEVKLNPIIIIIFFIIIAITIIIIIPIVIIIIISIIIIIDTIMII